MNTVKLAERFDDETARIEKIILIAGAISSGEPSEDLKEFFEDSDEKGIEEVFGEMPDYARESFEDEDYSGMCEWLYRENKLGFLIQFSTPSMTVCPGGRGRSGSWGCYVSEWVYADKLEDALDLGFAFVKAQRDEERNDYEDANPDKPEAGQ